MSEKYAARVWSVPNQALHLTGGHQACPWFKAHWCPAGR